MKLSTSTITKEFVIDDGKIKQVLITNLLTGAVIDIAAPQEFVLHYVDKRLFSNSICTVPMQKCKIESVEGSTINLSYASEVGSWKFKYTNAVEGGVIKAYLEYDCTNKDVFIDSVQFFDYPIESGKFIWSRPMPKIKSTIRTYFTMLGQPVYYNSFFTGIEFVAADNMLSGGNISLKYYVGRKISELGKDYTPHNAVIGAAVGITMTAHKTSFFEYVATFARPKRFRIQYNSWYDNMLDITHENIEQSFRAIYQGFKSHGLRDIDCYVVDDGWVDYKKSALWALNDNFADGFDKELKLTKELGSTFGIWFGPRGGYSQAFGFASRMAKAGYPRNNRGLEICCGAPNYISALCDRMADFMVKYNVTYFKIDGFAIRPCRNRNHNHPVGGYQDLYFYTFQWEEWAKGFDKLRAVNQDVFLNITSHSNCSPWALKYADAVWLNNATDMAYEGEGGDLDQCLNYRDGRYYDFANVRQLQFPNSHIYNHEPCYATRNYNPPLPSKSHKTVVYTDKQFEQYLYMCMMRGTGFIELYYTPSMFNDAKWDINTKVLKWAEDNFDKLSQSIYFGGVPKSGEVYGYIAYNNNKGYIAIRNPKSSAQKYSLDVQKFTHEDGAIAYNSYYANGDNPIKYMANGSVIDFTLKPYEMAILEFEYKR